jgi:hypothetical protein
MSKYIFYAPNPKSENRLSGEESFHASRVLRLKSGDPIYLLDGKGAKYAAILSNVDSKHKIKTNSYSNNSNINLIQNEIKNELNESLIIIDKSSNLEFFRKLLIPYIIYDEVNENINDYISNAIQSILFYKLQKNIK